MIARTGWAYLHIDRQAIAIIEQVKHPIGMEDQLVAINAILV